MNTDRTSAQPWWRTTWPLAKSQWIQLVVALIAVIAIWTVAGFVLTDLTEPNAITDLDVDIAESLAEGRTEAGKDLAHWSAFIADTFVKIGLTAVIVAAMLAVWRRWHEAVFVALTLIFEATAFATTTTIVARPRPDVDRLLESAIATSYPSGHVAAATVYFALAIIVYWHTKEVWARAIATAVFVAIPIMVAWARLYQGMHFFSDVIAGALLGATSIWIVYRIMGKPEALIDSGPHSNATTGNTAGDNTISAGVSR